MLFFAPTTIEVPTHFESFVVAIVDEASHARELGCVHSGRAVWKVGNVLGLIVPALPALVDPDGLVTERVQRGASRIAWLGQSVDLRPDLGIVDVSVEAIPGAPSHWRQQRLAIFRRVACAEGEEDLEKCRPGAQHR